MDIRKAIRRMAGSGLAVLTAIGLLGTAAVAQTASAADPTIAKQATHQYDAGEYTRDYRFDDYLVSGVTDYDAYRSWVSKNVADGLPVVGGFNGLCTYALKQGADGHWLVGRNLDTSGVMPSIRVRTHPADGYASVGNAFVMKASNTGEPTATELKASALAAPYFTADGVNEKGVSTALLALNNFKAPTDPSKKTINQFALTRLVLDHASSTAEAEQLIRRFNVAAFTASGKISTYGLHLAVADRTGDLAVFEWQNGALHVTHPAAGSQIVVNTATWTGAAAKDSRFTKAKNYLSQMTGDTATKDNLLRVMHQLPSSTPIQWSVVYDLNDMTGIQTTRESKDGSYSAAQSFSLGTAPSTPDTPATDDKTYDLWFGDSQMYGQGIKDANTRQTKRFSRLVSDADNATDVNVAVSGTNWTGTTSNRFGNQIDKLIANYSGKNVRRVIGQGVHNDAKEKPSISAKSTDAELKAKAQAIADTAQPYYTKLRTAFPNAQIAYIPQVTVWGTFQKNNAFFAAVLKVGAYLADDLKQQGWTVMDMQTDLDLIGDHQDYLADIIHVNEKGHAAAAQGIIAWLNTTDVPISSGNPSATVKVTFDPNGGIGSISPVTFIPGQTVTAPNGDGLSRDGWTFSGWNTKADGTGTKVKAGQSLPTQTTTGDFTLYAQWTRNSGGTTGTVIGKADLHKRITPTDERKDSYRLTLDVKGSGLTNKTVTPSDVVLLVDETNSMRECADGSSGAETGRPCTTGPSKRDNLGSIVDNVVTAILATNQGRSAAQQSRVSVVRFAGYKSSVAVSGFTTDKATALPSGWNKGDDLAQTGTDWATALENIGKAGQPRDGINRQVILITDGMPNPTNDDYAQAGTTKTEVMQHLKDKAIFQKAVNAYGIANRRIVKPSQTAAKAGWHLRVVGVNADASATALGVQLLDGKYPYVDADGDMGFYQKGSQPAGWLPSIEWLASVAKNAGDTSATGSDFKATDIDAISDALTSTVIIAHTMRDAVITDPLSGWVDPVSLTDGKGTGITVTRDGKAMTSGYTATYDAKARAVTVRFAGDLADGSVYAASFAVTPSEKAITDHRSGSAYPDTGDPDTGDTSAGKKGYVSNKDAVLSWNDVTTTNGVESSKAAHASYPHPVVQAPSIPIIQALPDAGNRITLLTVLAPAGCLLSLLGLGAVLVYRRLYGE